MQNYPMANSKFVTGTKSHDYPMASPEFITDLMPNEIFVFGSNDQGVHGKGAAKDALKFGAKWGVGQGRQGDTYAIPTKYTWRKPKPLKEIEMEVWKFLRYASDHPEYIFLVTRVGCGYAGHMPSQIAPMFKEALELKNVLLPESFIQHLK